MGKFLPDPDKFWTNPKVQAANIVTLRRQLRDWTVRDTAEMNRPGVTTDRRVELADKLSSMREVLSLLGDTPVGYNKDAGWSAEER